MKNKLFFLEEDLFINYIKTSKNKNAIFLGGDKRVTVPYLIVIENLFKLSDWSCYDIILALSDITEDDATIINYLYPNVIVFETSNLKSTKKIGESLTTNYFGKGRCNKFYSINLLNYYSHIIYLDPDLVLYNGLKLNIDHLLQEDFDLAANFYGPHDTTEWVNLLTWNQFYYFKEFSNKNLLIDKDIKDIKYFNSGVLIMSNTLLNKVSYEKLLDTIVEISTILFKNQLHSADESIFSFISYIFNFKLRELSEEWNYRLSLPAFCSDKSMLVGHCSENKWRDPNNLIQVFSPQTSIYMQNILDRLTKLTNVAGVDAYVNILNSIVKQRKSDYQVYQMIRMFHFYKVMQPVLIKFLSKSKFFYTEEMQNSECIILFCKNMRRFSRLYIYPKGVAHFSRKESSSSYLFRLRLCIHPNFKSFEDVKNLINSYNIDDTIKKYFPLVTTDISCGYMTYYFSCPADDIDLYLNKFENLFNDQIYFFNHF